MTARTADTHRDPEALLRTLRGEAAAMGTLRVPAALSVRRSCGCEEPRSGG